VFFEVVCLEFYVVAVLVWLVSCCCELHAVLCGHVVFVCFRRCSGCVLFVCYCFGCVSVVW